MVAVFFAFGLAGCATPGRTTSADPWQGMNRSVFRFNEAIDRAAFKPVAKGYKAVTPEWLRGAIGRVLANLEYPITMVNQLLQGKPVRFLQDTGRFVANSTLGIGGIFDVADKLGLPAHDEDFGQTLAVWGVPAGPYVNLPFLGPSSVRDAPSRFVDYFSGPLRYAKVPDAIDYGTTVLDIVDTRAALLATDATLDSAFDKYGLMRDAWVQRREYLIFDGNPPVEEFEEFEDDEDADTPAADSDAVADPP